MSRDSEAPTDAAHFRKLVAAMDTYRLLNYYDAAYREQGAALRGDAFEARWAARHEIAFRLNAITSTEHPKG